MCVCVCVVYVSVFITDNPQVSETMRDVVDGSIELVLRDNGKSDPASTSTSATDIAVTESTPLPRDFTLIYHEDTFDISEKKSA